MEGRQDFPFSEGFRAEKEQTGPLKEGLRILNSLSSPFGGMPIFMSDTLPGWSVSLDSVHRAGVIYPSHPSHPTPGIYPSSNRAERALASGRREMPLHGGTQAS